MLAESCFCPPDEWKSNNNSIFLTWVRYATSSQATHFLYSLLFYVGLFPESGWLRFIFVAGEGGETQK